MPRKSRLFAVGDINAFFRLMLDNMSDLVIMAGILVSAFGLPRDLILQRMLPGSAIGVLVGDLLYSWMAGRLARRTGRHDVTVMPLAIPFALAAGYGVMAPVFLLLERTRRHSSSAWLHTR